MATQTGITVRALHHYDRIGLFSPSQHSDTGHRLYTKEDIAKLQQIMSLKQLGFSLEEIKELIGNPNYKPDEVIRLQLDRLNEHIRIQEKLRNHLEHLHAMLKARQDVTAEQFIKIIEVMNVDMNRYFTPEQLEKLKERGEQLGPKKMQEVQKEWPALIAKVRAELEKGAPAESPEVLDLAKRWKELMHMFSGGDPEITKASERFYADNPDAARQFGIDGQLYKYISEAMSHI